MTDWNPPITWQRDVIAVGVCVVHWRDIHTIPSVSNSMEQPGMVDGHLLPVSFGYRVCIGNIHLILFCCLSKLVGISSYPYVFLAFGV
jgi:hypothetical protein